MQWKTVGIILERGSSEVNFASSQGNNRGNINVTASHYCDVHRSSALNVVHGSVLMSASPCQIFALGMYRILFSCQQAAVMTCADTVLVEHWQHAITIDLHL